MYLNIDVLSMFSIQISITKKKNSSDACHIERQDEKGGPPSPIIKVTSLEDPNDNTVILWNCTNIIVVSF